MYVCVRYFPHAENHLLGENDQFTNTEVKFCLVFAA